MQLGLDISSLRAISARMVKDSKQEIIGDLEQTIGPLRQGPGGLECGPKVWHSPYDDQVILDPLQRFIAAKGMSEAEALNSPAIALCHQIKQLAENQGKLQSLCLALPSCFSDADDGQGLLKAARLGHQLGQWNHFSTIPRNSATAMSYWWEDRGLFNGYAIVCSLFDDLEVSLIHIQNRTVRQIANRTLAHAEFFLDRRTQALLEEQNPQWWQSSGLGGPNMSLLRKIRYHLSGFPEKFIKPGKRPADIQLSDTHIDLIEKPIVEHAVRFFNQMAQSIHNQKAPRIFLMQGWLRPYPQLLEVMRKHKFVDASERIDPQRAAAFGAAICASQIAEEKPQTDASPTQMQTQLGANHNLGLIIRSAADGKSLVNVPLIERGSSLPQERQYTSRVTPGMQELQCLVTTSTVLTNDPFDQGVQVVWSGRLPLKQDVPADTTIDIMCRCDKDEIYQIDMQESFHLSGIQVRLRSQGINRPLEILSSHDASDMVY